MQHRYIVWQGRWRGRWFKEMHIIGQENKPICGTWKPASADQEDIWKGRPDGYSLCRNCNRKREDFEQAEKLRTWKEIATKITGHTSGHTRQDLNDTAPTYESTEGIREG